WGEISCILASLVMAPILLSVNVDEAVRLLVMAIVATATGIGVSVLGGPERKERLVDFYTRARPCGFWKPIAASLGEDGNEPVRRLRRGIGATLFSALSIFCVLTGVGAWMAGSPAPTWFPWPTAWIVLLLLVGAGLVPVWWRLGFGEDLPPAKEKPPS
ncbi:MAG: hypothetical protein ACE5JF_13540, partial [Anaerolineales bacterium]